MWDTFTNLDDINYVLSREQNSETDMYQFKLHVVDNDFNIKDGQVIINKRESDIFLADNPSLKSFNGKLYYAANYTKSKEVGLGPTQEQHILAYGQISIGDDSAIISPISSSHDIKIGDHDQTSQLTNYDLYIDNDALIYAHVGGQSVVYKREEDNIRGNISIHIPQESHDGFIKFETDNKGPTDYTIHASKLIKFKDDYYYIKESIPGLEIYKSKSSIESSAFNWKKVFTLETQAFHNIDLIAVDNNKTTFED